MENNDANFSVGNPARPAPPRVRRESCHSLFLSTLPTIHEVEPLVTPTPSAYSDGRPLDAFESKTNTIMLMGQDGVGPDDQPSQLSRIISATTHVEYNIPVTSGDQHMVTWGFTAFSVEKCEPRHTWQHGNKFSLRSLHDFNRTDKDWDTKDRSGMDASNHQLSSSSFYRMDSQTTDKTDPSAKLLNDSAAEGTSKTCTQNVQLRIMFVLGLLFVSGIIVWILSPFFPM
ncbi:hypothetical protein Bpfe_017449 [Biomphalaria pfeifferi]|uniref:Uncharacterized protein n=1 Tax=Biomphalaria pfeifferi TaxID=112525 RepID=A0AAD8F625_BIOPF|nr:hypothetical protein Bpfe_017449 [Biomphalaria pfeifferi]